MIDDLTKNRTSYFNEVASWYDDERSLDLLLLTHLLPDRHELIAAFDRVAKVVKVVAIPYSTDAATATRVGERYELASPTLAELSQPSFVANLAAGPTLRNMVVAEIGGYFAAPLEATLLEASKIVGIVEDTQAGHRRYADVTDPTIPIVSVAYSAAKLPEDSLVGLSSVFSIERILRASGVLLNRRTALVLGFGEVGRGAANALRARHCHVMVYDSDPLREVRAQAEGFLTPGRGQALKEADLIVGATGAASVHPEDLSTLKSGCILASTSSRDIEFPVQTLLASHQLQEAEGLHRIRIESGKDVLLLHRGHPVNFSDGAVIGPSLALSQAAMIAAVGEIGRSGLQAGLQQLPAGIETKLAQAWLEYFR